jgi:hypothetical protein
MSRCRNRWVCEVAGCKPHFENGNQVLHALPVQMHSRSVGRIHQSIMGRLLVVDAKPNGGCAWTIGKFIVKNAALLKAAMRSVTISELDDLKLALRKFTRSQGRLIAHFASLPARSSKRHGPLVLGFTGGMRLLSLCLRRALASLRSALGGHHIDFGPNQGNKVSWTFSTNVNIRFKGHRKLYCVAFGISDSRPQCKGHAAGLIATDGLRADRLPKRIMDSELKGKVALAVNGHQFPSSIRSEGENDHFAPVLPIRKAIGCLMTKWQAHFNLLHFPNVPARFQRGHGPLVLGFTGGNA